MASHPGSDEPEDTKIRKWLRLADEVLQFENGKKGGQRADDVEPPGRGALPRKPPRL